MRALPTVLLVDDGELDRIRLLLEELGGQLDHWVGDTIDAIDRSYDLVVSNPQRAPALSRVLRPSAEAAKPIWIAVHGPDSPPLRDRLRSLGVDFLIDSEIDSEILRLLLLRALYRGPERRVMPRALVGLRASCETAKDSWPATLIDLGLDGCRLTSAHSVEAGSSLSVSLPARVGAAEDFALCGRVVRVERAGDGNPEQEYCIAVAFEKLDAAAALQLDAIFARDAIGTGLARSVDDGGALPHASDEPEIALEKVEQRAQRRAPFRRRITALVGEASHVMLGRDLSAAGIRVEACRGLPVGAELRLGIYAGQRQEPVFVDAVVARDDGERGLALHFKDVDPVMRERLERITSASPSIEALAPRHAGEDGPVMVSKMFASDPGA